MINIELTDDGRIKGLEKLLSILKCDFSGDDSLFGAYLKGILLHVNGDVQLTYSFKSEKTYNFVFILIGCKNSYNLIIPTSRTAIKEINIVDCPHNKECLLFEDKDNGIEMACDKIEIRTYVMLSKAFSKEQAQKLTQEYSNVLEKKLKTIESRKKENGEALFRRDDTYNGIQAEHHIMYKLDNLRSKDGSIEYEFLIELDKNDPCLGIYYGCKGLIKNGDNLEKQIYLRDEWQNDIKDKVQKRLNLTFPEKKFDNRFKPTDNANDNTFWPFWISLHEDENIIEVAARATIIIRDEYKRHLEGDYYKPDAACEYCKYIKNVPIDETTEVHSSTRFTEESWELLCKPWIKESVGINNQWSTLLKRFIENGINDKLLEKVDRFEKAYMFNYDDKCLAVMMYLLACLTEKEKIMVPWENICRHFLTSNCDIINLDSIKTQNSKYWKKESEVKMPQSPKERINWLKSEDVRTLPENNYIKVFLKIMRLQ